MKEIVNCDYVAGELEIFEDEESLNRSTCNLKIIVNSADDEVANDETTLSPESNLDKIASKSATTVAESIFTSKKKRLISADSGFGSYGRSALYTSGSIDSMATFLTAPQYPSMLNTKSAITETNQSLNETQCDIENQLVENMNDENGDTILPLVSETTASEAIPQFVQRYEKIQTFQKNHRNTTVNSIDDANNFVLDSRLINHNDGFHEVSHYYDEHGSPKVREKCRPSRKKSTLKQELKARSLGASYDNNLMLSKVKTNDTPSCVSFTRLFKKLRETFCKFFIFPFFILFCGVIQLKWLINKSNLFEVIVIFRYYVSSNINVRNRRCYVIC